MAAFSHPQSHSLLLHPSSPSLLSPSSDPPLINNTPQLPPLHHISSDLDNKYQNSSMTFSEDFRPSVAGIHDASMVVNGDTDNVARKDNNWRNCRNGSSSDQLPLFRRISSNPNNSNQTSNMTFSDDFKPSVAKTPSPDTSMVVNGQHDVVRKDKKRRNCRNGSPSKEPAEGRKKRQKKSDVDIVKEEEKTKESKITKEPPAGYILVRARRGQATDSHSLAERVRREKISERMMMLQRLVPGCDKITGKALVLDEIINYVQSLQNQVEFLSMKLASVDPMFSGFTNELNTLMLRSESLNSTSLPLPSVPQCSMDQVQAPNLGGDYLWDNSASVFLQGHVSNTFSSEDDGSQFWDVEDQRQKFLTPYGFSDNLCSFH